jgi:predicted Zn-dependent peptidase
MTGMTIELTKLKNGLTVVTDPMPHLESASIGVWVNAGARNETPEENGLSHMLEHMAFKGTAKRTARQIAEEIERVGGYLNAYTAREQTAYYARILKADVPLAADILADILQNSAFDAEELERERGVVVQEIGQTEDTPDDIIFDHLQAQAFPDQAMGRPILGPVENVTAFSRSSLKNYMARHYHAPAMALIASGAVDHAQVVKLAEDFFGGLTVAESNTVEKGVYRGGEFRGSDDLEQAHLALAWPGLPLAHPDMFAAQIYSTALGGGMSSRLFQEAREKRGLCYAIHCFGQSFKDCGMFAVYAGTGADQASELMHVVAGEMNAMAAGPTEDEVRRAKAQMKAGLLMSLESPSSRCEQIAGMLWSHGRIIPVKELVAKLDAVTAADVGRYARGVAKQGALSLAALGPLNKLEAYDKIAARFAA